jgi:hypothetical protein
LNWETAKKIRRFFYKIKCEKFAKNEKLGKNRGKLLAKKGKKGYHNTIKLCAHMVRSVRRKDNYVVELIKRRIQYE